MKVYHINTNTIGFTPLMSYIVKYISGYFKSSIIESYIKGSNKFSYIVNRRYIKKYKDSYSFNRQTIFNKIYKYLYVTSYILKLSFNRKKLIIYSVDFQVVSIALIIKKIFRKRNLKIIYHQFELLDTTSFGEVNLLFYKKLKQNAKYLDLVIVPEKNRLKILLEQLILPKEKSFYFPNINNISTVSKSKYKALEQLPKNAKIIGHIGSIGTDHYIYSFLEAAKQIKNPNIYFIFVGKQNSEVKKLANKNNLKNIIFIDEIPHSELKNIYSFLDLGFILYKGIDDNFEYCAPNKLYEYWAYGVPVIAHKLKGLQSEFNNSDAGSLTNLNNTDNIIHYINKYLEKDRREVIIKYYKKNYNLDYFLKKLHQTIEKL